MGHKRADLIPVDELETASLMRVSNGRNLPFAFGTGGVALIWREAQWAVPLLAEWRGITFADGAGI